MRIVSVLLAVLAIGALHGFEQRKFKYLAGYNDVQIMSITHKGIQIMHDSGLCYLTPEVLGDSDKQLLAEELKIFEQRQIEQKKFLAEQKKLKALEAKKERAAKAAQAKVQTAEVNTLIKAHQKSTIYVMLNGLEKKFDVTKNRNMGTNGRIKAITGHLERTYPLARNRAQLVRMLRTKQAELRKQINAEKARKAAEKKRREEEAKKKQ